MNKPRVPDSRDLKELFQAVLALGGERECAEFFSDLCTPAELLDMADRWKAARLLEQGLPYREIYEKTGVSTATVTRVARALFQGRGGYRKALERRKSKRSPARD